MIRFHQYAIQPYSFSTFTVFIHSNFFIYRQLVCDHFNRCMNGQGHGKDSPLGYDVNEWPWIGLKRTSDGDWKYLNGQYSPEDNLWYPNNYDEQDEPCGGVMGTEYADPNFLQTYSYGCDYNSPRPSLCEFRC